MTLPDEVVLENRTEHFANVTNGCLNNTDYANLNYSCLYFSMFQDIWVIKPIEEVLVKGIALGLVFLFSIIANGIVIYVVFRAKKLQTPTNLFIVNVAVADLITSCYTPWIFFVYDIFQNWRLGPVLCPADSFIEITCLLASVFSLTVISCDRLLGIVYPFHRRLGKKDARFIILLVWGAAMIIATPPIFFRTYTVRQWADYTEIFCAEKARLKIYWIIVLIVMIWLPLSIMTIAYTFIIMKIDRYKKLVACPDNMKQVLHRRKVIRMLFLILITFFICWLPFQALIVYRSLEKSSEDAGNKGLGLPKSYSIIYFAAHYLAFCTCIINPIIYSLSNQKFRKAFQQHCVCWKKKEKPTPKINYIYNPSPR